MKAPVTLPGTVALRTYPCPKCPLNDDFFKRCTAGPTRKPMPERRIYRTPTATIDAFGYVMRQFEAGAYDKPYVEQWLAEHPHDRRYLLNLWREKKRRAP